MEEGKWEVGKTNTGKTLQIVRNPQGNMYVLQFNQGGEIPEKLRGDWNKLDSLMTLAKIYLESLNEIVLEEEEVAESDSYEAVS